MRREEYESVSSSGNGDALKRPSKLIQMLCCSNLGLKNQNSLTVVGTIKAPISPNTSCGGHGSGAGALGGAEFVRAGVAGLHSQGRDSHDFLHTIRSVAKGAKVLRT